MAVTVSSLIFGALMQRYIFTLAFIIVVIGVSVLLPAQGLSLRADTLTALPALFVTILLICLFVERAIEVFLSALRGGGADRLDLEVEQLQSVQTPTQDQVNALNDRMVARSEYRSHSRLIAQQMGLCFGLFIALVGFRILANLVGDLPSGWQARAFLLLDILLTGSVLAGGSDAVNKLTKAYGTIMTNVLRKSK